MKANDMSTRSPIMMRIFKEEGVLEVWKQKGNGRYDIIASYEICKWSGKLGPKFKEGDRQAPEGYYRIYPYQMNPNSSYYLSFNMGFPNSYDRSHNRTGSNLMVHGACSSAGCYSMTDEQVLEIYGFARDAFKGGQEYFIVEALPFRMTAENMARHRDNEHFEFWKMLKTGYDHFELTRRPPKVDVCERRYVFNQDPAGRECQLPGERRLPAGKHAGHPGIGLLCLSEDLEPGLHQGCRQVRPRGSQPDCRQRGPCRGRGTARRAGSRESRPPGRQRRDRLPPFRSSACFQPAIRSRRLSPVRNRLLRMAMHNRRQVRLARPKPVPARPRQRVQPLMSPFPRPIPRSPRRSPMQALLRQPSQTSRSGKSGAAIERRRLSRSGPSRTEMPAACAQDPQADA
jgi:hypothetical protein